MLPYKSMISINRENKLQIYLQISQQLTDEIISGRLSPGTKLPGSRKMSDLLGVNRNTIIAAYEELQMQGWLDTRNSSGTYIKTKLPVISEINYLPDYVDTFQSEDSATEVTYEYNFDDGQPDVRFAPLLSLTREMSALVKTDYFHKNLNYSEELRGDVKLREQISIYLKETRGITASPDCILLTSGTVNAFHLYLTDILNENDVVIVGKPGYEAFNHMLRDRKIQIVEVAVDNEGLKVDEIAAICEKTSVSVVYAIPHHHHPTTVKLSSERRMTLIQLSEKFNFTILEDDYDYDFHYDSNPVMPLASYDRFKNVVYVGSFSKLLMPSIRLGFMVGNAGLVNRLAQRRRYVDRCGNPLIERSMANLMHTGEIKRSLKKAVKNYRIRRNLLAELLRLELSEFVSFNLPEGGMAIWVTFNKQINLDRLLADCRMKGLSFSDPKSYNDEANYKTRLGFAMMNEEEIKKGFDILKTAIFRQIKTL